MAVSDVMLPSYPRFITRRPCVEANVAIGVSCLLQWGCMLHDHSNLKVFLLLPWYIAQIC